MTTLAVLTSGGDAPGMNTAIRAVVKLAAGRGVRVLGVENGYDGLIDGRFRELTAERGAGLGAYYDVDRMGGVGGTVLGSARSKRFTTTEGRAGAAAQLSDAGVDGLVVIGGNGSLTGAHLLATEHPVRVVGVPASIDNDIGCTGMAIGVDTALNTIVDACDRISDTARAHHRAFIVEVMGRDCGYLAMASSVAAGADAVLFREQGRDDDEVVARVADAIRAGFAPDRMRVASAPLRRSPDAPTGPGGPVDPSPYRDKRRVLIIKSEGVRLGCTELVSRVSALLASELPNAEVRGTVLGHLVRGGAPSYYDRNIAGRLALGAVDALSSGATDEMVAWQAPFPDGKKTRDPQVTRFGLDRVLDETRALLDGSSPVTKRRVALVEEVEGILGL